MYLYLYQILHGCIEYPTSYPIFSESAKVVRNNIVDNLVDLNSNNSQSRGLVPISVF